MKRGKRIGNKLIVYQEIESDVAEINSTIAHSTTNSQQVQSMTESRSQSRNTNNDDYESSLSSDDSFTQAGITELNMAVLDRDNFVEQTRKDPSFSPSTSKAQQIREWDRQVGLEPKEKLPDQQFNAM